MAPYVLTQMNRVVAIVPILQVFMATNCYVKFYGTVAIVPILQVFMACSHIHLRMCAVAIVPILQVFMAHVVVTQ